MGSYLWRFQNSFEAVHILKTLSEGFLTCFKVHIVVGIGFFNSRVKYVNFHTKIGFLRVSQHCPQLILSFYYVLHAYKEGFQ